MNKPAAAVLVLAPFLAGLAGCLENEEEISIRPDGSLTVRLSAKGDAADLAEGFALPLGSPWKAASEKTLDWTLNVGPDTGSVETRARVEAGAGGGPRSEVALEVEADFRSVRDLPRRWAPPSAPYWEAYLERETSLRIERKGARSVYVFERVFRARPFAELDVWKKVDAQVPDDVRAAADEKTALTSAQLEAVTTLVRDAMAASAAGFASLALEGIYTRGDASLSAAGFGRILERADAAARAEIRPDVIRRFYDALVLSAGTEEDDLDPPDDLDLRVREAVRAALEQGMAAEGVAGATRNAVRERLELAYTAFDHTGDLGDEELVLRLSLPGAVLSGNFAEREDGQVVWRVRGEELRDRDVVLRAVSVLE